MRSLLKSLFISIFPVLALICLGYGVFQFMENGFSFLLVGQTIVMGTVVALFGGLFIKPTARTDANLKIYSLLIFMGFFIGLVMGIMIDKNPISKLFPSTILLLLWIVYLKWYSKFSDRDTNEILKVGKQLIDFELEDENGNAVSSSSFEGKSTIYLFYRGNWCPLCMAQIKEIAQQYQELAARNVRTVLVSPQPHKNTKHLATKFKVGFEFMVDVKNKAATKLGILAINGIPAGFQVLGYDSDTVMPTVIITNSENKIIFADLTDNYRVRPEPETFLKVIDQMA
ncbi:peroxiredoxin family protein [Spongiivirga citrea]|uniref:Redoxin domain-containing protein n=1 Tax=Spongiivirga citrea TaxID=1481457 RepID=A0A6M0CQU6_9FLAO|nr:peroxiredoxin family protein [Spongiivirga citrea]NER18434.1 redoxin domain-containing protein [Spongiivirga citrea]